tara:strand:+ start:51406 stop:51654 length:249 start_codon:yes stop_codon:yes gene_type:complete
MNINNKARTFHHSEIGTESPEYIDYVTYNVLNDYDDLNSELISVIGLYPVVLVWYELKIDAEHYFVDFHYQTESDNPQMVES